VTFDGEAFKPFFSSSNGLIFINTFEKEKFAFTQPAKGATAAEAHLAT
jgi:hypothetical protein